MKENVKYLTPREIIPIVKSICNEFLLSLEELKNEENNDIKEARAIICYYLCNVNNYSPSSLGRFLNKKHSTIIYLSKRVAGEMQVNNNYKEKIERIINLIK